MHNQPRTLKKAQGHFLLWTFLIALGTAALLFVPFIIYHGGIFYYYGDFNVQEIPFYQMIHGEVQNGNLGWNHLTDLGTDTISSYSFYLLGSPFFWMTIPFPNEFVPYLIGPLLILKFACAASAAYIYLKRYVSYNGFAMLGGLLYAFSGRQKARSFCGHGICGLYGKLLLLRRSGSVCNNVLPYHHAEQNL